jgi:hypothetical protein
MKSTPNTFRQNLFLAIAFLAIAALLTALTRIY